MFDPEIDAILKRRGLMDAAHSFVREHERPAFGVVARRVSERPLRPGLFDKLLRREPAGPVLEPTASKWGGAPFGGDSELAETHDFLGQVNFAEVPDSARAGLPDQGLLTMWVPKDFLEVGLVTAWHADLEDSRTVRADSVGRWECRLEFEAMTSFPEGDFWMSFLEGRTVDDELEEAWFCAQERIGDSSEHQLGGWPRAGLYENYGFEAPDGRTTNIDDWSMVMSITFDNTADFGWGSNVVYVIAPPDEVKSGDLSGAVVVAANY